MGAIRTIGAVVAPNTTGWRTPVYTGAVIAAVSFSITKNIATIVLGAGNLPKTGYNGPNGYPDQTAPSPASATQSQNVVAQRLQNIQGYPANPANGQQVTLWGFTTATYFNGKTVTVIDNDPVNGSFRFYFTNANVGSTGDTGNTAAAPTEHYRAVRLEADAGNSTNIVYVGDLNVTATQYMTALTLAGQISIVIAGDNIPADRIMIFGSSATNCKVQVTLIY